VLDRTKCQTGGWLAFGSDKCGWLRALTTRVCACVLVAVEMPFSSTFSAAVACWRSQAVQSFKLLFSPTVPLWHPQKSVLGGEVGRFRSQLSLLEACFSSRLLAMSSSASSSMSSQGSILPIFVSFQSVCSCLSLSPPRISRLLFASPWVEMAPMRYFQQRL
jgi:hypothetical protein